MHEEGRFRLAKLAAALGERGIDLAIIADDDCIAYLAGFWGYFGMDFGRPTLLLVPSDGEPALLTPLLEVEMAKAMSWVGEVRGWSDDGEGRWERLIARLYPASSRLRLGVEAARLHPVVARRLVDIFGQASTDITPLVDAMRIIKSPSEIAAMRKAGRIAAAMLGAARSAVAEGAPEFEVTLASMAAGSRCAAALIEADGGGHLLSPLVHGLQSLQSGSETLMAHRRASNRRLRRGEPVDLCFCGMVDYRHYRLAFDRVLFVGDPGDDLMRAYDVALAAQSAALAVIRPGALAEEVQLAVNEVYHAAGMAAGYRTGRGIGMSNLEPPELKLGERSHLEPGMTLAVDGAASIAGRCSLRISDSIVVTDNGYDWLTPLAKEDPIV